MIFAHSHGWSTQSQEGVVDVVVTVLVTAKLVLNEVNALVVVEMALEVTVVPGREVEDTM